MRKKTKLILGVPVGAAAGSTTLLLLVIAYATAVERFLSLDSEGNWGIVAGFGYVLPVACASCLQCAVFLVIAGADVKRPIVTLVLALVFPVMQALTVFVVVQRFGDAGWTVAGGLAAVTGIVSAALGSGILGVAYCCLPRM